MKAIKTLLLISAFLITGISKMDATDRCVSDGGSGGCFPSITDAMNAAVNGDRIIIVPKAGGVPFTENLIITKSLQFVSDSEQVRFVLQGNITITPAAGRTVSFIGMRNTSGSVGATGASPAGARCKVTLMDCRFDNGVVYLNFDNFDVSVISSVFNDGYIAFRFGKLIGNDITCTINSYDFSSYTFTAVYAGTDGTASDDSILIIGNKVLMKYYNGWYGTRYGIYLNSGNQYQYVSNNFIKSTAGGTATTLSDFGIYNVASKNSSAGKNTISNNTIDWSGMTNLNGAIYIANTAASSVFDVNNNFMISNNTTVNGIFGSANSGVVAINYNVMKNPLAIGSLIDNGTNNLNSNTTLDANGKANVGGDAINGGAPDQSYYDINLTRNDAGAYGGSFTLDNYFPMTGATRVYMVKAPRKVVLGNTINVQADSFDR